METKDKNLLVNTDLSRAMFSPAFPCNPIPFLSGLITGCKNNGFDWLETNEAKRILFIVIALSYGQSFKLDSYLEFKSLK